MPPETCAFPEEDTLFKQYHDCEWGVPAFNDQVFFEKICLEGFQAGLSWKTILHRRSAFRQAFNNFSPPLIANYTLKDVERLMQDRSIIRNRQKILSVINNAKRFLELETMGGSLATLCWSFEPPANSQAVIPDRQWLRSNPSTPQSQALAKKLKHLGWSFVGPVNMYALMQALGIVNDHVAACPQRAAVERLRKMPYGPRDIKPSITTV